MERRTAIPATLQSHYAEALKTTFLEKVDIASYPGTIAGYFPVNGEIDVLPLLKELAAAGHPTCLPVTSPSQPLTFRQWNPADPLIKGNYGISTPNASQQEVIPSVILVPLLAFDRAHHRLGYGAGYYDRSLGALRVAGHRFLTVGVAFSCQELDVIPSEPHDEILDLIITEKGIIARN